MTTLENLIGKALLNKIVVDAIELCSAAGYKLTFEDNSKTSISYEAALRLASYLAQGRSLTRLYVM